MAETIAVSFEEGGAWVPFEKIRHKAPRDRFGWTVHAIKFDDGRVWDAYNGWRPGLAREPSYSHWGIHNAL